MESYTIPIPGSYSFTRYLTLACMATDALIDSVKTSSKPHLWFSTNIHGASNGTFVEARVSQDLFPWTLVDAFRIKVDYENAQLVVMPDTVPITQTNVDDAAARIREALSGK